MFAPRVAAGCAAARRALRRRAAVAGLLLGAAWLAVAAEPAGADPMAIAVLRTLDKVTARVSTIEVPVGSATTLGALEIAVRACDKRPPEEPPESAVFLEIVESKPNEAPQQLFSGWMFASSPALSALEHPVYDIWIIDCVNSATTDSETSP